MNSTSLHKQAPGPFVIPIFIAHQGCPHNCIFCNQHHITGNSHQGGRVSAEDVGNIINEALSWPRKNRNQEVQAAFYGGSFTGLDESYQKTLLQAVQPFIRRGEVNTVRISTRPDYINPDHLACLHQYGVRIVELGMQSLNPAVLRAATRGHDAGAGLAALDVLRKNNFITGAQIMVGLPGETRRSFLKGVRILCGRQPDFVRIYPTLVIAGSGLAELYEAGKYSPLSMNEAIAQTTRAMEIFEEKNIKVVRVGLQHSTSLEKNMIAGPYHPAFGELILARVLFRRIRRLLASFQPEQRTSISLCGADRSLLYGRGNCTFNRLRSLGLKDRGAIVFDPDQPRLTVRRANFAL